MIISDLSHFEDAVSEAPSIVGGDTKTTSTTNKLSAATIEDLTDSIGDLSNELKKLTGSVTITMVKKQNGASTATSATFKQGSNQIKVSTSSAQAAQN